MGGTAGACYIWQWRLRGLQGGSAGDCLCDRTKSKRCCGGSLSSLFRVRLSTGQGYEIRHPEFAALTKTSLFVGDPAGDEGFPNRMIQCDLLHVVAVEPIQLSSSS